MSARACVGLGGNLGDRLGFLRRAAIEVAALPGVRIARRSPVYESEPWGEPDQPPYLNAVLLLEVDLAPEALLAAVLAVEGRLGRRRPPGRRWGPRTIDLDVLLYGVLRRASPDPVLPHPHLAERAFVLRPLCDLEPDLVVPGLGPARELLAAIGADGGTAPRLWGAWDD